MRAVMFHLDDTLVYVKKEYPEESMGYALKQLGRQYTPEDIQRLWFESQRDRFLIERFGFSNPEDFWKVFIAYDVQHRKVNTSVFLDSDVVDWLKAREIRVGIVTSSNHRSAEEEISLLGRGKFDSVVCTSITRGIQPKPHPQGLEICMRELKVQPNETCYVGNDLVDMTAARNAGVPGVLLNRTGQPIEGNQQITIDTLYDLRYFR